MSSPWIRRDGGSAGAAASQSSQAAPRATTRRHGRRSRPLAGPRRRTPARRPPAASEDRFLTPILTGDELWCQLFSEPESGSDLASLRSRATRVDGGWRISGQKIWTSRAHLAANAILLPRTGGDDRPRHKGITYFLLPMDSPGVTLRPLAHMLGEAEFNEVFLDEVFVPDELVLGEVHGGWTVAMATLGFERVAIATGRVNTRRAVDDIAADVRAMTDDAGRPLGVDAAVRQHVADLYGRALVHHLVFCHVAGFSDDGP